MNTLQQLLFILRHSQELVQFLQNLQNVFVHFVCVESFEEVTNRHEVRSKLIDECLGDRLLVFEQVSIENPDGDPQEGNLFLPDHPFTLLEQIGSQQVFF